MVKELPSEAKPVAAALRNENEIWDEAILDVPDDETPERTGLRPSMRFFCTMAILGIALALGWRYSGAAETAPQLWAFVQNVTSANPGAKAADDPLVPVIAELAALKQQVTRLIGANQEMTTTIKALQAEQGVLRQRVAASPTATHLFSEPMLLQMNIVGTRRPITTGSLGHPATPRRAETRNRAASKIKNAPLALLPQ